jgi:uncharacterized protein (TIGR03067 family)
MAWSRAITLAVTLLLAADNGGNEAQKDMRELQGDWHAVSSVKDGKRVPFEKLMSKSLSIRDHTWGSADGEVKTYGVFRLGSASNGLKSIDLGPANGPYEGQTFLGIYDMRYGTFKTCFALPGRRRPTDFKADDGTRNELTFYKRDPS